MMMMGRDTPLKGELADRTLTLVGVKEVEAHVACRARQAAPATSATRHADRSAEADRRHAAGRRHADAAR